MADPSTPRREQVELDRLRESYPLWQFEFVPGQERPWLGWQNDHGLVVCLGDEAHDVEQLVTAFQRGPR